MAVDHVNATSINPGHKGLVETDETVFRIWNDRKNELRSIAEPILQSVAFRRLSSITFLGILSPRFASQCQSPIYKRRSVRNTLGRSYDGSRQSHSLGVALIALDICRHLNFPPEVQKYAVAWGLLHDIGNWPLSHTGEYAFSRITNTKTKEVRLWLVNADRHAPQRFWVRDALRECDIDPKRLTGLFLGQPDLALAPLSKIFRSPLTPDMLEGVWRTGLSFGVDVPSPDRLRNALWKNLFDDTYLESSRSYTAITFWRAKSAIYRRFFNSPSIARWESAWSLAILRTFGGVSLEESLDLSEKTVVNRVLAHGLPEVSELHRWKPLQRYVLRSGNKKVLGDIEVENLCSTLAEETMGGSAPV